VLMEEFNGLRVFEVGTEVDGLSVAEDDLV